MRFPFDGAEAGGFVECPPTTGRAHLRRTKSGFRKTTLVAASRHQRNIESGDRPHRSWAAQTRKPFESVFQLTQRVAHSVTNHTFGATESRGTQVSRPVLPDASRCEAGRPDQIGELGCIGR